MTALAVCVTFASKITRFTPAYVPDMARPDRPPARNERLSSFAKSPTIAASACAGVLPSAI